MKFAILVLFSLLISMPAYAEEAHPAGPGETEGGIEALRGFEAKPGDLTSPTEPMDGKGEVLLGDPMIQKGFGGGMMVDGEIKEIRRAKQNQEL